MLKPAALYKIEIIRKSQEKYYTNDLQYYQGYPDNSTIEPMDSPGENVFQFASVDPDDEVIGYICFRFEPVARSVSSFGMISFDKGNPIFVRDLHKVLDMIINEIGVHRMEWWCVDTNPVRRHYEKFARKYNGTWHRLRDVWKDLKGNYHDSYIFEIIFPDK